MYITIHLHWLCGVTEGPSPPRVGDLIGLEVDLGHGIGEGARGVERIHPANHVHIPSKVDITDVNAFRIQRNVCLISTCTVSLQTSD